MTRHSKSTTKLAIAAVGIVYGDIGTSPLYAMRASFEEGGFEVVPATVLGILSAITWTLLLVVTLKYLVFIVRADQDGEGGILALTALLDPMSDSVKWRGLTLLLLGLFGASLLYGDGIITPAISVLSAIEGLEVAAPGMAPWVLPITVTILVALFAVQRFGTARIGLVFGPIMIVWFLVLGGLGLSHIVREPGVLGALSPTYAIAFFVEHRMAGLAILGGVFLVATGAEALYADLGHFGRTPIRLAWVAVVLPCLLLNYFGQGALLLEDPSAISNPFYAMAPDVLLYPLIGLATVATVVASQAVIAGAFSLTYQAIHWGYVPRMKVKHTSDSELGQIYVPAVNWALMGCTVALVMSFHSSEALASAYGVAVTTTMTITTILAFLYSRRAWGWGLGRSLPFLVGFLVLDLSFFGANIVKIPSGGWVPLVVGCLILLLFTTWRKGRAAVREELASPPIGELMRRLDSGSVTRVPGASVFMSATPAGAPPPLIHHLDRLPALHETVLLLTVETEDEPRVSVTERIWMESLGHGVHRVIVRVGYAQRPNVPAALELCQAAGIPVDPAKVTYYFGRETIVHRPGGMFHWRERLFSAMARLTSPASLHFGVPVAQVVEVGARVPI